MAQNDNPGNWLPMSEVVAQTGLSQRTVYRMVAEGRLKQARQRIPGRRPMSLFDPNGVAEIVAAPVRSGGLPRRATTSDANVAGGHQSESNADPLLPPSELSFKLYLTEEEAIRYTGFGRAYLRAHGKGRAIGPHRTRVYRRVDLEKL